MGAAAEEEAKAWIAKREEAVARMRSGGPQVLGRNEEETLILALTLTLTLTLERPVNASSCGVFAKP